MAKKVTAPQQVEAISISPVVSVSPTPVSTLDSEIHRLSLKYQVSEELVRKIGKCESSLYKSAVNENKLKDGTVWSRDWGFLQVNDYYHEADMLKIGLHIKDWRDSLEYGILLLSKGDPYQIWSASESCWSSSSS